MTRLVLDTRPLRDSPAYRRLVVGGALSGLGTRMTVFAVALQAFQLTGSSAAVGAVALATVLPTLVIGIVGGAVADAGDRRRLVLSCTAAASLVSVALTVSAWPTGGARGQLAALYLLVALQAGLQALRAPAQRTFAPSLLAASQLPAGLALQQLAFQLSLVGGPALAGLLSSVGGVRLCYLVDSVSFLASLYAVWRLPSLRPDAPCARRGPAAVIEGFRFLRTRPVVAGALLSDLAATALAMPFAIFPAVNAAHFGGDPGTLGLLGSAPALGGVVAMTLSGRASHAARPGLALLVAGAVWGFALAVFGVATTLWLALGVLAVAGGADTLSVVLRGGIVQLGTPDAYRGRVSAVEYVVGVGGPELGNARGGFVAGWTSPAVSATSGGLSVVVAMALLAVGIPALGRHRAPTGGPPAGG